MVNTQIRLILFFVAKDGEALQSAKTRQGADCGSDHELLIAKFRLTLKKVGKTTQPFSKILYDYTVEVTNRFKGLDLIDRVPDELWTEVHDIVQEIGIKTTPPRKRNAKRQNGCLKGPCKQLRKEKQKAKEKRKDIPLAMSNKKPFLSEQCKEIEENNRMGENRDLFQKIRNTTGTFLAMMDTIKDRNGTDLTEQKILRRGG